MATSRRNFLFGRRSAPSAWGQFCVRLSRTAQGKTSWHPDENTKIARLVPLRDKDVWHAHALCKEYGVQLWLDGLAGSARVFEQPILLVEPGSAWAQLARSDDFAPDRDVWRVDAGCRVGQLQTSGFSWLQHVDPEWTIGRWLASDVASDWAPGQAGGSRVLQASVLLADGTHALLGEFGANARRSLQSLTVQKMVPKLFELSRSAVAQSMIAKGQWMARYRLDALAPLSPEDVNLAPVLTGHGGSLAWLWTVWLTRQGEPCQPTTVGRLAPAVEQAVVASFDEEVKQAFDPLFVFVPILATKGLESGTM